MNNAIAIVPTSARVTGKPLSRRSCSESTPTVEVEGILELKTMT